MGWAGRVVRFSRPTTVTLSPQDIVIKSARPLQAGLCTGSSDLIGWTKKVITQDDVGKTVAIFTAIEIKYGKTATTVEQKAFINAVNSSGGLGKIIHDLNELEDIYGKN